jgi:DNA-binding phage protein
VLTFSPVPAARIGSFREFWPYCLSQHRKRLTRSLHFFGTDAAAIGIVVAALQRSPRLLLTALGDTTSMDRTAFDDFVGEQMADPARAEAYREARTEIDTYDRFMRAVNALRESRGVSKATLASMSGLPAQSIRKLLTDKKANPTIATVFKMLSTMGFGLKVVPLKGQRGRRPAA